MLKVRKILKYLVGDKMAKRKNIKQNIKYNADFIIKIAKTQNIDKLTVSGLTVRETIIALAKAIKKDVEKL